MISTPDKPSRNIALPKTRRQVQKIRDLEFDELKTVKYVRDSNVYKFDDTLVLKVRHIDNLYFGFQEPEFAQKTKVLLQERIILMKNGKREGE